MSWVEYVDEKYKTPYWHNSESGESSWTRPKEFIDEIAPPSSSILDSKKKKKKSTQKASIDANDNNDEDEVDHLIASSSKSRGFDSVSLILDRDRVYADTEKDIVRYSKSLYCTSFLIEGPAAIFESILRCFLFIIAAIFYAILALLRWRFQRANYIEQSRACFREAIICFNIMLSLFIPGISCSVYRNHKGDGEWDLAPIPTLVGWVDVRRLAIFSLIGNGKLATWKHIYVGNDNTDIPLGLLSKGKGRGRGVRDQRKGKERGRGSGSYVNNTSEYDDYNNSGVDIEAHNDFDDDDDTDNENVAINKKEALTLASNAVIERLSDLHLSVQQCQDSWKGKGIGIGILCYPRKVHIRMLEILRGDSEKIIESAL